MWIIFIYINSIRQIRRIFCILGMHKWEYKDIRLDDNIVLSGNYKAGDFKFPVYVHIKRRRICGKYEMSYPDLPGSCGGKYKVRYD